MKHLVLFASLASCLPVLAQVTAPQLVADPAPARVPKFDWGLRLTKGQTWIQTVTTRSHAVSQNTTFSGERTANLDSDSTRILGFQNVVLDVAPAYYLVRVVFTQLKNDITFKWNGKIQEIKSPSPTDLIGVPFLVKYAPDGRVLDMTGLESLLARQKKTSGEATSAEVFKQLYSPLLSLALLRKPLAVGEHYLHQESWLSFPFPPLINRKRTLLSFDDQTAVFDDKGTYFVPPTRLIFPLQKKVTLTGDAAKLYTAQKYRATPKAQPTYLSQNGRIYYREAGKPWHVIWLDPPVQGIKLPESEVGPLRNVKGYDGKSTGLELKKFYGEGQSFPVLPSSFPKTFITENGVVEGKTTVDVPTGLVLQSDVTHTISGHSTTVNANGSRQSTPGTSTIRITTSIEKG